MSPSGALAEQLGVDLDRIEATIERYNENTREGEDTGFNNGDSAYGRAMGPEAPHPNLAPLDRASYYAVELLLGAVGTRAAS